LAKLFKKRGILVNKADSASLPWTLDKIMECTKKRSQKRITDQYPTELGKYITCVLVRMRSSVILKR
jgi:hypothetical protein